MNRLSTPGSSTESFRVAPLDLGRLRDALPGAAADIASTLRAIERSDRLPPSAAWGAAIGAALAAGSARAASLIVRAAEAAGVPADLIRSTQTVAASTLVSNLYHRAGHGLGADARGEGVRLRVRALMSAGGDVADRAVWALATSAAAGCEACVEAHAEEVRAHLSGAAARDAVTLAAAVAASARVLDVLAVSGRLEDQRPAPEDVDEPAAGARPSGGHEPPKA